MKPQYKIPDEIIFTTNYENKAITFGDVRNIVKENELINLLENRLDRYLITQVQPLLKNKCAFPLSIMTCIGIETLGEIFINKNIDDSSYQFVQIISQIDQRFGRKINKKYENELKKIWEEKSISGINSYGKIVYKFFRNNMIHGYHTKGLFLSYEDTEKINIDDNNAFIIINPNWFWNSFYDTFIKLFKEITEAQSNNTQRKNCLKYITDVLLK